MDCSASETQGLVQDSGNVLQSRATVAPRKTVMDYLLRTSQTSSRPSRLDHRVSSTMSTTQSSNAFASSASERQASVNSGISGPLTPGPLTPSSGTRFMEKVSSQIVSQLSTK